MTLRCVTLVLGLVGLLACGGPEPKEPPVAPTPPPPLPTASVATAPAPSETSDAASPTPPADAPTASAPVDVATADDSPSSEGTPSLGAGDILAVLRPVRVAILRKCLPKLPEGAPATRVKVKLTIGKNGNVGSAAVEGGEGALGACVVREMRALKFPKSSGETKVSIPFVFHR